MSHGTTGVHKPATTPNAGGTLVSPLDEAPPSRGPLHPLSIWSRIRRDKPALFGLALVLLIALLALFAPVLAPNDPRTRDLNRSNEPPAWMERDTPPEEGAPVHVLGSDIRGQDILSRVIYGARVSLLVGLSVVIIASLIGVTFGCIAGYAGGMVDSIIMRVVDILLAFPFLILALALVSIFPNTQLHHIVLVLGLASWPGVCRLMRGQVLATRENDYVSAARALGAGHTAILVRHILPNCIAPVLIWFTMGIAGGIMGEASLSFLGLGEADSLSWGSMINNGLAKADFPTEWWPSAFPAIILALTVLGFNLFGDGLQDAINPRAKK